MQADAGASPPTWARTLVDPDAFRREQERLGHLWTLLGVTWDARRDGDWFRASLGGRSVFVQRFGDRLVGFENVCAHRFYPLRTEDRGHGPIRCGFHHWQYDQQGVAVGIPKCRQMYGVTPKEMNARLRPVEIATCGDLVFGRFASDEHREGLEEYLGDAFQIVRAMWTLPRAPRYIETPIAANWKLPYHISLDDYHVVAVHPDTFGKGGYLESENVIYERVARHHSAYLWRSEGDSVETMARECEAGAFTPRGYSIFQLFPNTLTNLLETGPTWSVLIQVYVPVAHDRCVSRAWLAPAPVEPPPPGGLARLWRRIAAPFAPRVVQHFVQKVFAEDNTVCEEIQRIAPQIDGFPRLARHEERIGWFEEVYAGAVADRT